MVVRGSKAGTRSHDFQQFLVISSQARSNAWRDCDFCGACQRDLVCWIATCESTSALAVPLDLIFRWLEATCYHSRSLNNKCNRYYSHVITQYNWKRRYVGFRTLRSKMFVTAEWQESKRGKKKKKKKRDDWIGDRVARIIIISFRTMERVHSLRPARDSPFYSKNILSLR